MLDSRTRVRGLILAAVCAAALGLAACGDDDDDATTTDTGVEATETTETTETTGEDTTTEETTDDSGETTETTETTETGGDVSDQLRAQLEAAGISSKQVDCVVDELESTLGEDVLEDLQTQTTPSEEVIDASTEAAQKCLTP